MPLTEDVQNKWSRALARLRARLGSETYTAWFSSLQLEDVRETRIYTSVPTHFLKRWIEDHYLTALLECIQIELPESAKVLIVQRVAGKPTILPEAPKAEEPAEEEKGEESESSKDEGDQSASNSNTDEDEKGEGDAGEEKTPPAGGPIKISMIIRHACYRYKLRKAQMISESRTHDIVRPRMIGMFLSKHMTKRSLPDIGERFGGRDHTTVLHSIRKIERLIAEDIEFAFEVAGLEATIRGRELSV